jgi:hypothetical protein
LTLREARREKEWGSAAAVLALGAPMAWLWGFSVDDALITARVAAHIASGIGHRFNSTGPVVDAVTPLGFAYVLAPASEGDPLRALYFAKWLGAVAGLVAMAWLGASIARTSGRVLRWAVLVPLALSAPLAAWCVSGMETGVVVLFATLALSAGSLAPLASGLAAAFRPELVLWSATLCFGRSIARRSSPGKVFAALALAVGPAVFVAVLRFMLFGHPAPLAVWAKPSDMTHGLFYVLAALIWSGAPALVAAPIGLRKLDAESRAIVAAVAAHCLALILAGGDWMALFRLFVPVLPGLFLVGARLASFASPWATLARVALASGVSAALLVDKGQATRGVLRARLALIAGARPALAGARRVAALDVGWVGAATQADIVDLAGVTDPVIARLPGGHTSKRLPPGFLRGRGVDALVLLVEGAAPESLRRAVWSRVVEARAGQEAEDLGFKVERSLELSGTSQRYLVLRLQNGP